MSDDQWPNKWHMKGVVVKRDEKDYWPNEHYDVYQVLTARLRMPACIHAIGVGDDVTPLRLVDNHPIGFPVSAFVQLSDVAALQGSENTWNAETSLFSHSVARHWMHAALAKAERIVIDAQAADPTITPETHVVIFQEVPVNPDKPYDLPLPIVRLVPREEAPQ